MDDEESFGNSNPLYARDTFLEPASWENIIVMYNDKSIV
jgi:hypothetical protein